MTDFTLGVPGTPPKLSAEELANAQAETLAGPTGWRRVPSSQRMDLVYGKARDLAKFRVLEQSPRVPYQAWEQVAYVAITHTGRRTPIARHIHDRVMQSRAQHDNEQWHLLILTELIDARNERAGSSATASSPGHRPRLLPPGPGVLRGAARLELPLERRLEDHAEHEFTAYVAHHPELEDTPTPRCSPPTRPNSVQLSLQPCYSRRCAEGRVGKASR
jgi:ubiquinol oxidase